MVSILDMHPIRTKIKSICAEYDNAPDQLLEILHAIIAFNKYIPEAAYQIIADSLNISRAEVYGVVTFYHDFRRDPPAKKIVKICQSEACQSMGSRKMLSDVECGMDQDVAIEVIYCLGNCALAPSALVDGKIYGRLSAKRLKTIIGAAK